MLNPPLPVRIVFKDGPVVIQSLNGAAVSALYDLWDGIGASEFFPPNVDSAFYVLTVEKLVRDVTTEPRERRAPDEPSASVRRAERALIRALELLAAAWPFSGGSVLCLEASEVNRAPRYKSNATEVDAELLARMEHKPVAVDVPLGVLTTGTYRQPPLRTAVTLAKAMCKKPRLLRLLTYYQQAVVHRQSLERPTWFIDLYKVCDVIGEIHNGRMTAPSKLGIEQHDWDGFKGILNNNDLRHAVTSGTAPEVASADVDRVYDLAHSWIRLQLLSLHLPVSP
jgi:hypothetical protein